MWLELLFVTSGTDHPGAADGILTESSSIIFHVIFYAGTTHPSRNSLVKTTLTSIKLSSLLRPVCQITTRVSLPSGTRYTDTCLHPLSRMR
jgi:hypothetical protein